MKTLRLSPRSLFGAGLAAVTVLALLRVTYASAPADQYAEFSRSSTEIADRKTKLIWRRTPASGLDWNQAKTFCASSLQPANSFRLPTAKELLTLVDEEPHDEYVGTRVVTRHTDQSAFGGFPDSVFWSSDQEGANAYALNLEDSTLTSITRQVPVSVRCVRKF